MTNSLTYFTATGFFYDIESPIPSGSTSADQFNALTGGFVTFTPRVPTGFTVLVSSLDLGSANSGISFEFRPQFKHIFSVIYFSHVPCGSDFSLVDSAE